MRGKVQLIGMIESFDRITPAYAGKSSRLPFIPTSFQDHPRLCGEKQSNSQQITQILGSPPPMRGKGCPRLDTCDTDRITPAYAGKSRVFTLKTIP